MLVASADARARRHDLPRPARLPVTRRPARRQHVGDRARRAAVGTADGARRRALLDRVARRRRRRGSSRLRRSCGDGQPARRVGAAGRSHPPRRRRHRRPGAPVPRGRSASTLGRGSAPPAAVLDYLARYGRADPLRLHRVALADRRLPDRLRDRPGQRRDAERGTWVHARGGDTTRDQGAGSRRSRCTRACARRRRTSRRTPSGTACRPRRPTRATPPTTTATPSSRWAPPSPRPRDGGRRRRTGTRRRRLDRRRRHPRTWRAVGGRAADRLARAGGVTPAAARSGRGTRRCSTGATTPPSSSATGGTSSATCT